MKNNYRIEGDKVYIDVFYKKERIETVVSLIDFDKVNSYKNKWYVATPPSNPRRYVVGWKKIAQNKNKIFHMHRFIHDFPEGLVIDHINHDTLNNTRENTRIVTNAENNYYRKYKTGEGKSKKRHVFWCSFTNKWRARIYWNKKIYDLGRYATIDEALKVVEAKKKELGLPY